MAMHFDFQMPAIDVLFKLTIWMARTAATAKFEQITQLQNCVTKFFAKSEICQFIKY